LLAIHALILIAFILPVVLFSHYPLIDWPEHVARQYFIAPGLAAAPSRYFFYDWEIVPTIGMDLFVQALVLFLDIEVASRIFVVVSLILIYCGTVLLSCAINGRITLLPAIAALFLYNGALMFGFVQFVFSIGVALIFYACWILTDKAAVVTRLAMFSALTTVLYVFHMFGFGLYLLAVAGYELQRKIEQFVAARGRPGRAWWRGALTDAMISMVQIVPSAVLFLMSASTSAAVDRSASASLFNKVEAIAALVFFASPRWELPLLAATAILVSAAFLLRMVRINSSQILVLALLALAFLIMPRTLLGSGYASYRMPSGAIFFFIAALSGVPEVKRQDWLRALSIAASIILAIRLAVIMMAWSIYQPLLAEYDAVASAVPLHAKLLVVEGTTGSVSADRAPPFTHLPALMAGRRAIFVPYVFTGVNGTQIRVAPDVRPLMGISPLAHLPQDLSPFEYLMIIRPETIPIPVGFNGHLIASGSSFKLFALR